MSAFRDLVMGQGCTTEAAPAGNNPLAKLFSGLLDSTQKHEQIPRLPDMHITSIDREKIASRASVVTRHVFPGERFAVVWTLPQNVSTPQPRSHLCHKMS